MSKRRYPPSPSQTPLAMLASLPAPAIQRLAKDDSVNMNILIANMIAAGLVRPLVEFLA